MYSKRSRVTDFLITIVFVVVVILIGVSGYFHYMIKKRIYEDSYLINKLGLIRGNIQRYSKLKIANIPDEKVFENINTTIIDVKFLLKKEQNISMNFYKKFINQLNLIEKESKKLQLTNNKLKLITISENLWYKTNNLVQLALQYHKYKFEKIINMFNYIIYSTIAFLILIAFFIYKKVKKGLEIENITDKLTGLYNRLYFNEIYEYLIEKYRRDHKTFSMLIIDIDNFKKINDTYGHSKGDEVLKSIGKILKETIRKVDFAFRYGGEEFIIIFPDTDIEEAYKVAQRILRNIPLNLKIENKPVTISGGISEYKGASQKEFFEKVDKALYFAKKTGKNKIIRI